ncbi:hypothetical protein EYF80_059255 [Liparis tanakae]|uniref:Uncharacterized protein n=1 Tax=Liparis tanakae TaxID=230148 RepID=A0A4Z2ENT1_9TELE|nr:hypothetical protein EYF80_059255 [Liparis tanakae]
MTLCMLAGTRRPDGSELVLLTTAALDDISVAAPGSRRAAAGRAVFAYVSSCEHVLLQQRPAVRGTVSQGGVNALEQRSVMQLTY